uniref:Basic leucine zipper ATF-like transcription factor 2 n=1 Tax=Poecilia reticulata TaxID=8081 RepID=A0A3P9Q7Z9_POERE
VKRGPPMEALVLDTAVAGEGNKPRPRVTKRREKNRDAARKSRRKQTERADELHEELQSIEQSNSALQKEIAKLKKDLRLYETALERHKPHCPKWWKCPNIFIQLVGEEEFKKDRLKNKEKEKQVKNQEANQETL